MSQKLVLKSYVCLFRFLLLLFSLDGKKVKYSDNLKLFMMYSYNSNHLQMQEFILFLVLIYE